MQEAIQHALDVLSKVPVSPEDARCRLVGDTDECNLVASRAALLRLARGLLACLDASYSYGKATVGHEFDWESDETGRHRVVWYGMKGCFSDSGEIWPVAAIVVDDEPDSARLAEEFR